MSEREDTDDTMVSLKYLQASNFPLMRRLDQHHLIESRWNECESELSRLSNMNKSVLASLEDQERRLKKLQEQLHSSPTIPNEGNPALKRDQRICSIVGMDNYDVGVIPNDCHPAETSFDIDDRWTERSGVSSSHESQTCDSIQRSEPNTSKSMDNPTFISHLQQHRSKANSIPDAPKNVVVTDIYHDSYTIEWDISGTEDNISDYEICYNCSAEGRNVLVSYSCARWCLKHPIPQGKFKVLGLEPNTEYQNTSIRRRNKCGWSEYSTPIELICTVEKGKLSRVFNF